MNQAQSYWDYANDPFGGNWAAWNYITSTGTDGLAYQTGDFIGTNATIAAFSFAGGAPFAGGGGVTSIFNGERVSWPKKILENFDEDATGLVSRIPKGADVYTTHEQVGGRVYEIIHSGTPVSPAVKALFFEAVQVFPSKYQSLESIAVIDTYSILTPKGKYIRGLTVFDDLGEATVYLTRDADFLTYLDEGGHVAGATGKFDSHQRIYGYLNGPGGSQKFADYLHRQGVPPEAQQQYFEKAKSRLDRAIKEKR